MFLNNYTLFLLVVLCTLQVIMHSANCTEILLEGQYKGHYRGQNYNPEQRNYKVAKAERDTLEAPHARSIGNKEESRNFKSFSDMINQLSSVLFDQLLGIDPQSNINNNYDARNLAKAGKNKENSKDDLYYHTYPHNQHLFNLPECATQQVCNAVYKRLNFTQPLCACAPLQDPCSASYLSNDLHTIELKMGGPNTKAVTLIKTCERTATVRNCRAPRDWSILALQNTRTGKAHYLVICKCPDASSLEGPIDHDQPTVAQVQGIKVYGMMCIRSSNRRSRRSVEDELVKFPWNRVSEALGNEELVADLMSEENDS